MQPPHTWRSILGDIIEVPGERQRIAKEIGIVPITLTRWTKNDGVPRLYLLAPLIQAVPEKERERLRTLMKEEFPGFSDDLASLPEKATGAPEELLSPEAQALLKTLEEETPATREMEELPPKSLYAHMLAVFTNTRPDERFWPLCALLLPHALKQLDPHGRGMELVVA